jgi:hypothetical protein
LENIKNFSTGKSSASSVFHFLSISDMTEKEKIRGKYAFLPFLDNLKAKKSFPPCLT